MNKNFKLYIICWAILLALFNVICFVTPNEAAGLNKFGGAFWIGYIFITAAFIGQLVCAYIAFKAENLKKLFYNLPLITLSYTGLVLMLVLGGAAMAIPNLPAWVGAIVCLLILGFNAIAVIKANWAAEIVESVDEKIIDKTEFIKNLITETESLISHAKNEQIKEECKKVYEAVRYSDPMSNIRLADIECRINEEFSVFTDAVLSDNSDNTEMCGKELLNLLSERNSRCKNIKQ